MAQWLALHFPQLILDHLRRGVAEADAPPMALIDGPGRRILHLDDKARQQGVQPGHSLATALSLCPDLYVHQGTSVHQDRILRQLADQLYPWAAPLSLYPPDTLLVRACAMKALYPQVSDLAHQCLKVSKEQGFVGHWACAPTPPLAAQLSRHQPGQEIVTRDALEQCLKPFPVTHAGWPQTITQRLQRMGLGQIGALLSLPAAALAQRLGPEWLIHLEQLCGRRSVPQTEYHPPERFLRHLDLPHDISHAEALIFPLQRLLQELQTFLQRRQQSTDTLLIALRHRDTGTTRLRWQTARGEYRSDAFLELARLHLEKTVLPGPVIRLTLYVPRLADQAPADTDLFGHSSDTDHSLQHLIHRLQARLGETGIRQPACVGDHRPERAHGWNHTPAPVVAARHPRPLWLLSRPSPLSRPPQHRLHGPERIQGGWWDGQPVCRDYYVARMPNGALGWIYRNEQNNWFLHGWFG